MEDKKKQNIYVRLLEGTTSYVPCEATQIDKDVYEITKNEDVDLGNDAISIWEFFPGDKVKCVQKTESFFPFGGGVLIPGDPIECKECETKTITIASQLIESSFPDRGIHQLIFLIVKNLGEISLDQLRSFEEEIKRLCSDNSIVQRRHPIVEKWLNKYCSSIIN